MFRENRERKRGKKRENTAKNEREKRLAMLYVGERVFCLFREKRLAMLYVGERVFCLFTQ